MKKEMSEKIAKINEMKLELMKEKGQAVVGGSVTNPGKIRQMKKTVARLLTAIKNRRF